MKTSRLSTKEYGSGLTYNSKQDIKALVQKESTLDWARNAPYNPLPTKERQAYDLEVVENYKKNRSKVGFLW